MQVFKLAPPTTEWPLRTTAPRFVPGSVNLINCQHEFLDLRSWPIHATTENTTLIIIDCQVLYPDLANTLTTLVWNINTGAIFPCNVRAPPNRLTGFLDSLSMLTASAPARRIRFCIGVCF